MVRPLPDPEEALLEVLGAFAERGGDYGLRLEGGAEYAWSLEVRLTPTPNVRDGPDVSTVLFFAGGASAADIMREALPAVRSHVAAIDRQR
jgi:hypothetical protein